MKARYAPHRELVVHLANPSDVVVPGAVQVERTDATVRLRFDPVQLPATELVGRVLAEYPVTDLSLVEPSLDGVIHQIYADRTGQPA